jgi:hypothetical protein
MRGKQLAPHPALRATLSRRERALDAENDGVVDASNLCPGRGKMPQKAGDLMLHQDRIPRPRHGSRSKLGEFLRTHFVPARRELTRVVEIRSAEKTRDDDGVAGNDHSAQLNRLRIYGLIEAMHAQKTGAERHGDQYGRDDRENPSTLDSVDDQKRSEDQRR